MLFTIKLISPLKLASSNSRASAAQDKETSSFTAGTEPFGAMNVTGTTALLLSITALFEWIPCDFSVSDHTTPVAVFYLQGNKTTTLSN